IIHCASNTVATIIAAIIAIVAGRVMTLVFVVFRHACDNCAKHGSRGNGANIMSPMVIHPGTRIETIPSAMVITTYVCKDPGATLCDPHISAVRVIAPRLVKNAGRPGDLVNEL